MREYPRCQSERVVRNEMFSIWRSVYWLQRTQCAHYRCMNIEYPNHNFDSDTMKLSVLWYFRYPLSFRNDVVAGINMSHQSVFRCLGKLGLEFGEKARNLHRSRRTVSWYVNETNMHWLNQKTRRCVCKIKLSSCDQRPLP